MCHVLMATLGGVDIRVMLRVSIFPVPVRESAQPSRVEESTLIQVATLHMTWSTLNNVGRTIDFVHLGLKII